MALADIIARIDTDAAAEAGAIVAAAHERAETTLAAAREKAAAHLAEVTAAAKRDAERDAETIVVNARLAGRDALVSARRALVEETLAAVADKIAGLPDEEYVRFLSSRIAEVARPGETVVFGEQDAPRAASVLDRVAQVAPALQLTASPESAPFARGALLIGPRVRTDLSLSSLVDEHRDRLELVAAAALFGEEA